LLVAAACQPRDGDPICKRVREVAEVIASQSQHLLATGKHAFVVIVTDGQPTDGDLWTAMEPLTKLPVKLCVRLCCEEPNVIRYWSRLDALHEQLELFVIDNLYAAALEAAKKNKWLSYTSSIHHVREWGIRLETLDLIEERPLTGPEIRELTVTLLGAEAEGLPNPQTDWAGFSRQYEALQREIPQPHSVLHGNRAPWVDLEALKAHLRGEPVADAAKGECGCTVQ
ncbi:hypothetical protein T492DRAFT_1127381, partial [Pavlovales sp. CCMP2436]